MGLLTTFKRDVLDLASLAIADRDDVRTARGRLEAAEAAFATTAQALQACRGAWHIDEAAVTRGTYDRLEVERQKLLEPGLAAAVQRARVELMEAQRALTPIEKAARAECRAARVAGRKVLVAALFAALAGVIPENDALVAYEQETARLLGQNPEPFDTHAWVAEFVGDASRESLLEFRRRLAREAGLL